MSYLLLGDNFEQKENKIQDLLKKFLATDDARKIDYESLSGHKLDLEVLQEHLPTLPVCGQERVIVLRACERLNERNQEWLINFLATKPTHLVLILESSTLTPDSTFAKKLKVLLQVIDTGSQKKVNVFDMTNALSAGRQAQALQLLADLLESGAHPLQIMGGVVWFWGKMKTRLSSNGFEQGLFALQEADVNIKRSRLAPTYALEVLLVKLGQILG